MPDLFIFVLRLENQRDEKAEENRRRDSRRGRAEPAGEDAQESALLHRFSHTLGKGITKARERHGCARPGEVRKGLIDAERAEDDARDNVSGQNARGGKLGIIYQNLTDDAQHPADGKGLYIIHYTAHNHTTLSIATAWQMPGMLSPCWALVVLINAPVAAKRTRFQIPFSIAGRI